MIHYGLSPKNLWVAFFSSYVYLGWGHILEVLGGNKVFRATTGKVWTPLPWAISSYSTFFSSKSLWIIKWFIIAFQAHNVSPPILFTRVHFPPPVYLAYIPSLFRLCSRCFKNIEILAAIESPHLCTNWDSGSLILWELIPDFFHPRLLPLSFVLSVPFLSDYLSHRLAFLFLISLLLSKLPWHAYSPSTVLSSSSGMDYQVTNSRTPFTVFFEHSSITHFIALQDL